MRRICISLIIIFNFMLTPAFAEFFIIVNKENLAEKIGAKELKDIYRMRKKMWNGDTVLPVNLKRNNPVRMEFSEKILGKSPKKIEKLYLKRALSGQGQPPKMFTTEKEVINYVTMNKGAIGYVSKTDSSVKVINVK